MGKQLAGQALNNPAGIRPTSRLVLVRMALEALDDDAATLEPGATPCLYWGGHDLLANVVDPRGKWDPRTRAREVRRAVQDCVDHSLVHRVGTARRGWRQVYLLTVRP